MPSWEPGRATPSSKNMVQLDIEQLPKRPSRSPAHFASTAVAVVAAFGAGAGIAFLGMQTSCAETSLPALFDASMGIRVPPSQITPLPAYSTSRMVRSVPSYAGTTRENATLAAGTTSVLGEDGSEEFTVTTEVIADAPFGEFAVASPGAPVSQRSFRLVFTNASGAQTVIIPFGISAASLRSNTTLVTLRPNFFFVQYYPAGRRRLSVTGELEGDIGHFDTFASSLGGQLVATAHEHQQKLEQVINPILHSYGNAAKQDAQEAWTKFGGLWHTAAPRSGGRQLHHWGEDIGNWAGSKIGDHVTATGPFGPVPPSPPAPVQGSARARLRTRPPLLTRSRVPRRWEMTSAAPSAATPVKWSAAPLEGLWQVQSVQTSALSRGVRWARGPVARLALTSEARSVATLVGTSAVFSEHGVAGWRAWGMHARLTGVTQGAQLQGASHAVEGIMMCRSMVEASLEVTRPAPPVARCEVRRPYRCSRTMRLTSRLEETGRLRAWAMACVELEAWTVEQSLFFAPLVRCRLWCGGSLTSCP